MYRGLNLIQCLVPLFLALTLTACSDGSDSIGGGGGDGGDGGGGDLGPTGAFVVAVLSSEPDQVSNDEARIGIEMPDGLAMEEVAIDIDGRDVSEAFRVTDERRLEGRVDGLDEGDNTLSVSTSVGRCGKRQPHPDKPPRQRTHIFRAPAGPFFLCGR